MKMIKIEDLFHIHNAKSKSIKEYSVGNIPFVSNGVYNNGVIGFVEPFDDDRIFEKGTISVSSFCDAIVHHSSYIARGNGGSGLIVLEPKIPLSDTELMTYSSLITSTLSWKYSYGRMVTKKRFEKEYVPVYNNSYESKFSYNDLFTNSLSLTHKKESSANLFPTLKRVPVTELFKLDHGDFHSINGLSFGDLPTVSRLNKNNGIVGYYELPDNANIYKPLLITVSTVTGDAFVQLQDFIATDNVVLCFPRFKMKPTTLFFIAMSLNREKWRWSYGRQCYKNRFSRTEIYLPLKKDELIKDSNIIDEDIIENLIIQQWGWEYIKSFIK